MKRVYSITASAVAMLCSLAPVHAMPKPKTESSSTEAQAVLERIDASSAAIADTAFHLTALAKAGRETEQQADGLEALKIDINKVGSELQALEAERDSLSEWEAKALDHVLPLMHDAASNTERALQLFNSDPRHLWATPFVDDTAKINKDADQVSALLRDYIKLENTREKESRIEQSLGRDPVVP